MIRWARNSYKIYQRELEASPYQTVHSHFAVILLKGNGSSDLIQAGEFLHRANDVRFYAVASVRRLVSWARVEEVSLAVPPPICVPQEASSNHVLSTYCP